MFKSEFSTPSSQSKARALGSFTSMTMSVTKPDGEEMQTEQCSEHAGVSKRHLLNGEPQEFNYPSSLHRG